jgi:taurine--2-oxoglutarate transaminase
VVELVRDPDTRESPSAWPESPPALKDLVRDALQRDVSFAIRGNLILLAPPLVIGEQELSDALTLLDELLAAVQF